MQQRRSGGGIGCLGLIVILAAIGYLAGGNKTGGSAASAGSAGSDNSGQVTGTFVRWLPLDEGHGYAYFSVTNHGSTTATAKCTVTVRDDFGDFGFDMLVGETVGPGQTISGRMPIGMGKGAYLVNEGEVTGC